MLNGRNITTVHIFTQLQYNSFKTAKLWDLEMVSQSEGEERAGGGEGAKIKIDMLIALLLIQFSSNSPAWWVNSSDKTQKRKKQGALRGWAEGMQTVADGHISNFTLKWDLQHRGCGVSSKTNKWKCRGIKWAEIDEQQCGRPSGKKLPFVRIPWLWGMGPADRELRGQLRPFKQSIVFSGV